MKFCTYLARSGHTHCARPVVVEMGHLVGESLDDVNLPVAVIMDHDVVRRRDGSLTHVLTHQEEVIPRTNNNDVVRRRDGSLTHVLTHQEEVIPRTNNNDVVRRRDGSLTHVLTHQEEVIPKGKGMFSYSAVSSPLDRSKRFIHFFCPSWQTCSLRHQLGFFGKHSVLYKWPY